ncbi:MAG: sensor histidine kinase [Spirochaetales bacterium]|nr:sensor histidine kinase [Spirochaetales bacterium]
MAIFIMQLVFFKFVTSTVTSSTLENRKTLLNQLVHQIDSYIAGIERISQVILDDNDIENFLENPNDSNLFTGAKNKLTNYKNAREDISNILLYPKNGKTVISDPFGIINPWSPIKENTWYENAISEKGRIVVSESYVQNIILGEYTWVVSLSREIFSPKSGESLGVILVDLKFNRIEELCNSLVLGDMGYDFIIDNDGNYIFHPTQQLINSNLRSEPINKLLNYIRDCSSRYLQDNDKYYISEKSLLTNWNIVSVTDKSDIITDWQNVQVIYTLIGFILFLIVGPATKKISVGITKPIRMLQNKMKTVENGDFNIIGPIKATEELKALAYDYDIMVGKIRELIDTNNRDQELKRKSDLKALQAQINPHFLYNTLDSIIWMGEMGQNREVVQMTSALSKLFRISISKGHEIITIRDEISHVQSYLTIQEMRYQKKFDYLIDIDPELQKYSILKITLQPLVENAIYHGIKESDKTGFIKISGKLLDSVITLSVEDNGDGMSNDMLEKLINGVEYEPETELVPEKNNQGMGLRNVHQRIQLYFGSQFGLSITSILGTGTIISIRIPAKILEKKK